VEGMGQTLERLRELGVTSVEHLAEFTIEDLKTRTVMGILHTLSSTTTQAAYYERRAKP